MVKIMFNDACRLTDAVIQRRKTRTTRFEKFPDNYRHWLQMKSQDAVPYLVNTYNDNTGEFVIQQIPPVGESKVMATFKPRYHKGETIAVAQQYRNLPENALSCLGIDKDCPGYWNKMFVKANYMPWAIRITDIEIFPLYVFSGSEQLCLEEGIQKAPDVFPDNMRYCHDSGFENAKYYHSYGDAFASLIDEVAGRGTWKRYHDRHIVSYSFELVENNFYNLRP